MIKTHTFFAVFLLLCNIAFAQHLSLADKQNLQKKEDSLKTLAIDIIQGRTSSDRLIADSQFTKIFVRALKINNSFYYPFDSLITISRLVPEDSTFKIFT
ncbi:MAG: hypothetical protein ABJA71_17665, partial [Ginsengibacter sp.]